MGCRHSTPRTRGGAALRPRLVPVRAASRDVRDSASSLEAGQLSAHAGSSDSKRPPREDRVDDASEETKRNESFAAKASARRDASALNGTHTRRYTARFSRGTPVVPVTDNNVACLSTDGDRRTATETRASDRSSTSLESGTDESFLGSANDVSDDERGSIDRHDRHDRHDRSDTDATSVLFMSTFDGTEAKTRSPEESPDESLDALLRETRALLNRSAPGRFGAESRFPRESNTEADDAATGRERIDMREKQGSARVPVLEAYDEAHARRKKTRGGEPSLDALRRARLAFSIPKTASAATRRTSNDARTAETSRRSSARESAETKAHTKPSPRGVRVPSADGAKGAQGAQGARPPFRDVRQSATDFAKDFAKSPSPTRGALAAPFERVRRRSAERAARASRSGTESRTSPCHESQTSSASKTLLDGATRRRLAEATATLARVEASRREKFSAAHPARASSSSSRGQTVSAEAADRARRLGDVLAEYRSVRGSSTIETATFRSDAHRPTVSNGVFDENAKENAKRGTSLSSRARFFAGTSNFRTTSIATSYGSIERHGHEEHEDLEDLEKHEKHKEDTTLNACTMPFASPTVRATPLTSGAPKRVVAPMSEKMRLARGALRALQIPGAEPAAPRRARVAAQAERVSSAATFVATQRVSAPTAAACAARPASHLVGHRDRYG